MKRTMIAVALFTAATLVPLVQSQQDERPPVGSNAYVDMYFTDWHTTTPKTKGSITEYTVFTKGDPMKPTTKGAVLRYIDSYAYDSLAPNASTSDHLSGQQRVYYFTTGTGTISAGGDSAPVSNNIAVLVPANLVFTIKNTGADPLGAYVITEPTPRSFKPGTKLVVKNEELTPINTTVPDWSRLVRPLFRASDGLATIDRVATVTLDELTITRPVVGDKLHTENLWMELSGTSIAFIGPYLRRQTPGIAYEHPPDNLAPTANVNYSEDHQIKLLVVETEGK